MQSIVEWASQIVFL